MIDRLKKYVALAFAGTFSSVGVMVLVVVGILVSTGVIQTSRLHFYTPQTSTTILDAEGDVLRYLYSEEHRVWIDYEDISSHIVHATIAMEDHRFYSHVGVDVVAIARALRENMKGGALQGGSTITQQFVKNAFLSPDRTISRKVREAYLAVVLELTTSKQDILELYLNEVSYGDVYHGVETAAQYYFGTSASDVSVSEAAVLASLTKAPSKYSLEENSELLKARRNVVLAKMNQQGFITDQEYQQAKEEKIVLQKKPPEITAPHFTEYVIDQLHDQYNVEELESGLTIHTTLEPELQAEVETAVVENVQEVAHLQVSNGAALVLEAPTGAIRAWVGSKDFYDQSIDGQYDVLTASRQPGSTLKPFLYALALEEGHTAATKILDGKTYYKSEDDVYSPVNYDSQYRGPVSIRQALASSLNVPATRMLAAIGIEPYLDYLEELSLGKIDPSQVGVSLVLGGYEVRPIDLATAYTALANQGTLVEPVSITKVVSSNGTVLESLSQSEEQASQTQPIDSSVAYLISDILNDNQARSLSFGRASLLEFEDSPVAVKTGTSNNLRDNWAVGYTPEYVTLAWVGNSDGSSMSNIASGVTGATPIWRDIQENLFERESLSWYTQPATISSATYHKQSGGKYCEVGTEATELFIEGTEPTECLEYKPSAVLLEERDGQTVTITTLSPDEVALYEKDPFQIIERYKDIMRADDVPTPVFIERKAAIVDPLVKLMPENASSSANSPIILSQL